MITRNTLLSRLLSLGFCLWLVLAHSTPLAADNIWVDIAAPGNGEMVLEEVEVEANVVAGDEIKEVELWLDGTLIGVMTSPPYRLRINLGVDNIAHQIMVIARDITGAEATDTISTSPVSVGSEVSFELQQIYATVTTRGGRRIKNLSATDFSIRDNKQEQTLVSFARGDIPFTAVILIDASASMHGDKLAAATAGAATFVRGMAELDFAQVIAFSDRMLNTTPLTDNRPLLTTGLTGARASGGTALHDHLYTAVKLLEQRQGRRVVIILSDGIDTHSILSMAQVRERVRRSQALIYWIRLSGSSGKAPDEQGYRLTSSWRSAEEFRDQLEQLKLTVRESGGQIITVDRLNRIQPVFVEILQELRDQYVLGYYPSNAANDGRWHAIKVKVLGPEAEVRTHEGYVDL